MSATVLYLHGFASSTRSSKAAFFARKLAEHGIELHSPDLNEPDFSTLTVTRMLKQVGSAIEPVAGPIILIGSSLGGFVGVHAALQHPLKVTRLVLLAPALQFGVNRLGELGASGLDGWRETDRLDVFHYGYGRTVPVHFGLYTDAARYDTFNATLDIPIQVFQGRHDATVDPDAVERWARARPNVELHLLDDDHQLLGSLDYIWRETERFLVGPGNYQQIPS